MAYEDAGNPAQFNKSGYWNTQPGQDELNNYKGYTTQQRNWKNNYLSGQGTPFTPFIGQLNNGISSAQAAGGGGASFWSGTPDPNDSRLRGYQANIMGDQRNATDALVRNAANAGVAAGRGGMGVSGAAPTDSVLRANQIGGIAQQAASNYKDAYGMAKDFYGGLQNSSLKMMDILGSTLGKQADVGVQLGNQELQGLSKTGDVQAARRADYGADQSAQQTCPLASFIETSVVKNTQTAIPLSMERSANVRANVIISMSLSINLLCVLGWGPPNAVWAFTVSLLLSPIAGRIFTINRGGLAHVARDLIGVNSSGCLLAEARPNQCIP